MAPQLPHNAKKIDERASLTSLQMQWVQHLPDARTLSINGLKTVIICGETVWKFDLHLLPVLKPRNQESIYENKSKLAANQRCFGYNI